MRCNESTKSKKKGTIGMAPNAIIQSYKENKIYCLMTWMEVLHHQRSCYSFLTKYSTKYTKEHSSKIFIFLWLLNLPCHEDSIWITVFGITHDTLNKANTRNHNSQAVGQRSKRCSTVSSPILQQHQSIHPKLLEYGFSTD